MTTKVSKTEMRSRLVAAYAAGNGAKDKAKKAADYAEARQQAKDNRPKVLERNVRIRARTERQILACDRTGIIPEKTCLKLGILKNDAVDTSLLQKLQQAIRDQHKALAERNEAALVAWREHLATINGPKLEITPI